MEGRGNDVILLYFSCKEKGPSMFHLAERTSEASKKEVE